MQIRSVHPEPLDELRYLNAGRRGRAEVVRLPILRGTADLPDELDALVCASDLQGMAPGRDHADLLGVALADWCVVAAEVGELPAPERTGVILAGDLWADPSSRTRGGYGPVLSVWRAFAERFRWVAGVAGNHDDVSGVDDLPDVHLLDGDVVELDGIRLGGVGRIIGNERKAGRRSEGSFHGALDAVLVERPELVVLHEGPDGGRTQRGNRDVAAALVDAAVSTAVCGHVHWREPLADLGATGRTLNVDARCVVLLQDR